VKEVRQGSNFVVLGSFADADRPFWPFLNFAVGM
jgi:hypothetical protein